MLIVDDGRVVGNVYFVWWYDSRIYPLLYRVCSVWIILAPSRTYANL